nr:hypothetical protein [Candidatus Sigynarchaeota archaeon]
FFGAFDQQAITIFKDTVNVAGPSKFLLNWMYKTTYFFYKLSPLKDKFPIKGAIEAERDARDLESMKKEKDMENLEQRASKELR